MTAEEKKLRRAIRHIVHEYANFVSSAEMVLHGTDVDGRCFKPPINTHVSHAFYLNCRKLADFFLNRQDRWEQDTVLANQYSSGYSVRLRVYRRWCKRINKQLAHITYARDTKAREIKKRTLQLLYAEFKTTWRRFRKMLPKLYADEFVKQIKKRKSPYRNGEPSEFRSYDLD